jgi:hypothetical protein
MGAKHTGGQGAEKWTRQTRRGGRSRPKITFNTRLVDIKRVWAKHRPAYPFTWASREGAVIGAHTHAYASYGE